MPREAARRWTLPARSSASTADWLALVGDPHDVRPILIDQVYRMRDALNPSAVDEIQHYGTLDPTSESLLRQRLATLSLLTEEIARSIHRLPYHAFMDVQAGGNKNSFCLRLLRPNG